MSDFTAITSLLFSSFIYLWFELKKKETIKVTVKERQYKDIKHIE